MIDYKNILGKTVVEKYTLFFFLIFFLCGTVTASSAPLTIRLGVYENSPKVFSNNTGEIVGIFPDLLETIAQRENWQIKHIPCKWTQCLEKLESAEIDVMVDVAYSKNRAEKFYFTNETVFINWATIYSQQGLNLESLLDLQGKKVAVMK